MSMPALPEGSGHRVSDLDAVAAGPDDGVTDLLPAELDRIRKGTYSGRDPDHLASVVVDGDGTVVRVRLAATAHSRESQAVERAVLAAMAAAQGELERECNGLAARLGGGGDGGHR